MAKIDKYNRALNKIKKIVELYDAHMGPPCYNPKKSPNSKVVVLMCHGDDYVELTLGDCRAIVEEMNRVGES